MSDDIDPLNLTLGSVLQMQATLPENAPRHSVRLIGAMPGGSLVVTTPSVNGNVQIVREGQRFNLRALQGEKVMGFIAQVLLSSLKPYPHLHLEYPSDIEQIVVRDASRVVTDIAAAARMTEAPNEPSSFHDVTLVDLSESGAKIASRALIGGVGELLHVKFDLLISGEIEELGLIGDIMNNSGAIDGHYYTGVRFRRLSRYQKVLLHAWVTNHILQETLRSRGH